MYKIIIADDHQAHLARKGNTQTDCGRIYHERDFVKALPGI